MKAWIHETPSLSTFNSPLSHFASMTPHLCTQGQTWTRSILSLSSPISLKSKLHLITQNTTSNLSPREMITTQDRLHASGQNQVDHATCKYPTAYLPFPHARNTMFFCIGNTLVMFCSLSAGVRYYEGD